MDGQVHFQFLARLTYLTYRIPKSEVRKPIVVNVDHLKPFEGKNNSKNWLKEKGSP